MSHVERRELRTASWVQRVYGRLNRRLLAWFLVFSLLPVIATNAIGYARSASIIAELVERFLVAYARLEAQHVGDRTQERLQTLRALTAGNDLLASAATRASQADSLNDAATDVAVRTYLSHLRTELRVFDAIALFSIQGKRVVATDTLRRWGTTPRTPTRNAFAEFVEGEDSEQGSRSLRLVVPVLSRGATVVGYIIASVRRDGTAAFLQLPEYDAGHIEGLIFDSERRPLASSVPHDALATRGEFLHELLVQSSGAVSRYHDSQGRQRIAAVADVPQSTWRFVAEVSAEDALLPLRRLGLLSLLLEFVLGVMLVGAAIVVAREIVGPVRRLAVAAGRVASGDLSVHLPVRGYDEVAELGHAFNEMTRDLAQANERVDELHKQEIERASQLATVGELASGLAHEIKNPVIGITNGLDLVRRRIGDDAALAPILDEMARQLLRIGVTVQELLLFARPATPHMGPVSANLVVARAIRLILPAAERAGVTISVTDDPSSPRCHADEEMIYQALVNLLMNAVQATPAGGMIRVSIGVVDNLLEFEIADSGRGIPAAELQNVFRPFYTTRHTGTGLGLSITQGIVVRHGGTMSLDSTEGAGTTVRLHLPLRPDEPGHHPEYAHERARENAHEQAHEHAHLPRNAQENAA